MNPNPQDLGGRRAQHAAHPLNPLEPLLAGGVGAAGSGDEIGVFSGANSADEAAGAPSSEVAEALLNVERASSAMAMAAAPASSSQVRASMTRELGAPATPMLSKSRKPPSTRSTWPAARTSATRAALASPPSSPFTRACTFSALGQPVGALHVSVRRSLG
jgi:hypothetical protein